MSDTIAEREVTRPTHHMHEGDPYGVVPGPAHTCITSVKAESVFVLTVEEHARLLADAEQRGELKALRDCTDLHCAEDKALIRGWADSLAKAIDRPHVGDCAPNCARVEETP